MLRRIISERTSGRSAWNDLSRGIPAERASGFVAAVQSYNYLSAGVSCFQIPNGFRSFTQAVTPIDDRCDFSALNEFTEKHQVLLARLRNEHHGLLPSEQGRGHRFDRRSHSADHRCVVRRSDDDESSI